MSRSLSARCLQRSVLSHTPSHSHSIPRPSSASRRYAVAALKTRPLSDREYPRRQEDSSSYSRVTPHEPDIRIQEYSRGSSQTIRERKPPARRRLGETDGELENGKRTRAGDEGAGSSGEVTAGATDAGTREAEHSIQHGESGSPRPAKPDLIFSEHLNGLFSPLKFPPELSARILTHASHPAAFHGHNAQFSFIGRRVLESYLLLLLTSSPHLKPSHDLQEIVSRVLNTYYMGEHVGSRWGLGRVMRWTPTIASSMLADEAQTDKTKLLKDVGLYKVQGDAVTAVMGGIFQQFGGSVAHRVFHTRVLPRLLLPQGGLPVCFHPDANAACARLGGARGDLVLGPNAPPRQEPKRELLQEEAQPSSNLNHRQTL